MKRQRRLIPGNEDFGPKSVAMISDETSPVERLIQQFETHETHEAVFVRSYREMLKTTTVNPTIRFLIELVVADEEKHQQIAACHDFKAQGLAYLDRPTRCY